MIVPMLKVFIVTQNYNQAKLLDILAHLGVMHLEPVDPGKAIAEEKTLHTLSTLDHAIQILQQIQPSGNTPDISPLEAANEAIAINKTIIEEKEQLSALHRTAAQLAIWGNVELKNLNHLRLIGIEIRFFSVAGKDLPTLKAECIEVVGELSNKNVLIAVVDRMGTFRLPEGGREIPWPNIDLPSVKKEAAAMDLYSP